MSRTVGRVLGFLLVMILIAACAPAAPTPAPTKPPAVAPTPAAPPQVAATPQPTAKPAAPAVTPTAAAKPVRGGVLKAAVQNDWVGLFPLISTTQRTVMYMVFDQWTEFKMDEKGNWVLAPRLIAEWDQKPDSVTLRLQTGVKFHDGSDWNAELAKWNMEQILTHPKSALKGTFAEVDEKNIQVIDSHTLKVGLKRPSAPFVANLADDRAMPASKAAIDKLGEAKFEHAPVGTGPFTFLKELSADSVTLQRNESYWRKGADGQPLPYLDGVVYRLIIDDSVRLLELKAGNVDFSELIAGKDIPGVKANQDLVFLEGPWAGNHYRLMFNSQRGPFAPNQKLRQAALYAIDREAVAKTLGQGAGQPLKYLLPPGNLGYDESYPYYGYDKAKAEQLLKEAGYANGLDAMFSVISRVLDTQMSQIVKQMWDAIGIRTTIDVLERAAFTSKVFAGDYETGTARAGAVIGDPDSLYRTYFHSKGSFNLALLNNSEMDKCVDEAASVYDTKQREATYKRCQQLTHDLAYYGYVWVQTWNWVFNKKVQGLEPAPAITTLWYFDRAWLKR